MKWTNRANLPQPLVTAIQDDPYSKGDCDYSVSELLSPPRISALKKKYESELEEDVIDYMWVLLGKSVHTILERANHTGIAERRLYGEVSGKLIGGGMDIVHKGGLLQDYKITNTFKVKLKEFKDWEAQLNSYNFLLSLHNEPINTMEIVAILRDWVKSFAKKDPKYPRAQVMIIPIPIWPLEKTKAYLEERIRMHEEAKYRLPECSLEDRWSNYKTDWNRCESYCPVASKCDQFKQAKGEA